MRESLSAVGKVESVSFHHWTRAHEICDGVCTARMVRSHTISCNVVIDGFPVKVSYPGQALECDISEESGHIAKKLRQVFRMQAIRASSASLSSALASAPKVCG